MVTPSANDVRIITSLAEDILDTCVNAQDVFDFIEETGPLKYWTTFQLAAKYCRQIQEYRHAEYIFRKLLEIAAEQDREFWILRRISTLQMQSVLYGVQDKFEQSASAIELAIEILQELRNSSIFESQNDSWEGWMAKCLSQKAGALSKKEDRIPLFHRTIELLNTVKYDRMHSMVYSHYCSFFLELGCVKEALKFALTCREKASKAELMSENYEDLTLVIGNSYFRLHDWDKARKAFEEYLKFTGRRPMNDEMIDSLLYCAIPNLMICGRWKEAKALARRIVRSNFPKYMEDAEGVIKHCENKDVTCALECVKRNDDELNAKRKDSTFDSGEEAKWLRKAFKQEKQCEVCHTKSVKLFFL